VIILSPAHLVAISSKDGFAIHFVAGKSGLYTRKEKQLSTKNRFFSGFRRIKTGLHRIKVRTERGLKFKDEGRGLADREDIADSDDLF